MRICSSVGRVTLAVPLLVTDISFLPLLEFLQHDVQPVESFRPRALVALHPVVDGLERVAVQPVQPLPSFVTHVNRSHFSEHSQVLGHLWLSQPEQPHQVVHGALAAGEDVKDLPPPGLGHRVERICCRRCSCHGGIVYLYGNMSTAIWRVPLLLMVAGGHLAGAHTRLLASSCRAGTATPLSAR